jgi:hypothetical protein
MGLAQAVPLDWPSTFRIFAVQNFALAIETRHTQGITAHEPEAPDHALAGAQTIAPAAHAGSRRVFSLFAG